VNADWFYSNGDDRKGPVTEEELRRLIADGQLKPGDLVWQDGMADWVEARTVESLFPKRHEPRRDADDQDRPTRRRFDPDGTPAGRSSRRDDDEVRPSHRVRPRDEIDDDDRPRVRRREFDDRDDDYDRPRRRRNVKPGQVQTVGIMMLVGGILGILYFLSSICLLFWWPGVYYELVIAILLIIRGSNMLNRDDQGPPRTLAILQIICIVSGDVINCVMGIVALVMLNDNDTVAYYRKKGFES
jgi:GYF domain 2